MKYFIVTFGCQQNLADSERIAGFYQARGFEDASRIEEASVVVINTCVVKQQAEDRIYGLVENLKPYKEKNGLKIVVTGCLVGAAARDPTGNYRKILQKRLPLVDEFLPIEEVGFEYQAVRNSNDHAWVPISVGCNNFCTFCIVPFSRGREISRPFDDIVSEVEELAQKGYRKITLLGQNVNSYGADLILGPENIQVMRDVVGSNYFGQNNKAKPPLPKNFKLGEGVEVKPVYVKHLGRYRIPTLFPQLLLRLCQIKNLEKISFLSSNPWDFSDELIEVIANHQQIDRLIHLPVQSGDDEILRKMNRWYTSSEYLSLVAKLRQRIAGVQISTDIIVGFPGETWEQFENTVRLAKKVGFVKAYISKYSPRPGTAAFKIFKDDVSPEEKTRRFHILDQLINHRKSKEGDSILSTPRNYLQKATPNS